MLELYKGKNPAVSVIMATFNRAGYLNRSINSYLSQTFKDSELVIVDDGSNDDTFVIANKFIKKSTQIRYLKHTNRKLSLSRNAGIRASAGRYIAFLDSDDEYLPTFLEDRYVFMESQPQIDLLEGGITVVGDPFIKDKNDLSKKIHLSDCIVGATFFGRRRVFFKTGGFDKRVAYSEDSDFWERASLHFKMKKFDRPGYIYYRNTPGSISNSV